MRLFADTGNLEQLRELKEMGVISGVTTNPTIASREGQSLSKTLSAICELFPDKPVFGQVVETEKDKIIAQALKIGDIAQNIVVKIPATEDGIKAIAALKSKNRRVCATTVLTSAQALMAALAGADYVAPYVDKWDVSGYNGFQALEEIIAMFHAANLSSEVLAASIHRAQDVVEVAKRGCDILTIDYSLILSILRIPRPLVDGYVDNFLEDWHRAGCSV